ncbi:unnamed protein product [Mycena citricolor]|uniref:ubiquitinyl hydrolase 1 n=2 Tax=Mycena citricolor TaxID=2018698 RepID=A0AAD2HUS5_9AGAR|nr:unnamed protein product [Mycena citricolor]
MPQSPRYTSRTSAYPPKTTYASTAISQFLPLLVLFLVPLVTLRLVVPAVKRISGLVTVNGMGLFGFGFWSGGSSADVSADDDNQTGSSRRRERVRTRAAQQEQQRAGHEKPDSVSFPGLFNVSGTHCFMNSTLQALASLSALMPHLSALHNRAEQWDVPTPVLDALLDLLHSLNTPSRSALRATALVEALCASPDSSSAFWGISTSSSKTDKSAKAAALLATHQHQDAQEFFQLLSEAIREETALVAADSARDRGFAGLSESEAGMAAAVSPFDGLTATRRACVRCGYVSAIRHFSFDSLQLALEGWNGTTIHHLLTTYTELEVLEDCPCRRCSLRATAYRLTAEAAQLAEGVDEKKAVDGVYDGEKERKTKSKKRREKEKAKATRAATPFSELAAVTAPLLSDSARLRRLKATRRQSSLVGRALESRRIEEEDLEGDWDADGLFRPDPGSDALKGVRLDRVPGGVCTRQSMIGRLPAVLALHINRSVHTGYRAAKNGAFVAFPEVLDLTAYTTSGVLNVEPTTGMSDRGILGALRQHNPAVYHLAAAVCHYGQHSFGHYICFRRAPVPSQSGSSPSYSPALPTVETTSGSGRGWLRISDARVDRCGIESVLAEGSSVFMLYYERVHDHTVDTIPRGRILRSASLGLGESSLQVKSEEHPVKLEAESSSLGQPSSTSPGEPEDMPTVVDVEPEQVTAPPVDDSPSDCFVPVSSPAAEESQVASLSPPVVDTSPPPDDNMLLSAGALPTPPLTPRSIADSPLPPTEDAPIVKLKPKKKKKKGKA